MRRMQKKAALELSINAIVIVILAMTLLGLGLGFVRNMFDDISGTTEQVQEQMRDQITEQLRTGDKPLAFPTSEITISKKESRNLAMGIRNTLQGGTDFKVRIYAINETTGERKKEVTASSGIYEPILNDEQGLFVYNKGKMTLGVNQDQVLPVKYSASTTVGTSIFEIVIFNYDATLTVPIYVEYSTKSFFITIV